MNNDLERFSEERLKELAEMCESKALGFPASHAESAALARIALAAKQAKPIGYIAEVSGNRVGVLRGLPMPEIGLLIYTTPLPAHTEQVIPDGWKLVPMTATIEMHKAAEKEYSLQKMYSAMLRAAPKPESE